MIELERIEILYNQKIFKNADSQKDQTIKTLQEEISLLRTKNESSAMRFKMVMEEMQNRIKEAERISDTLREQINSLKQVEIRNSIESKRLVKKRDQYREIALMQVEEMHSLKSR